MTPNGITASFFSNLSYLSSLYFEIQPFVHRLTTMFPLPLLPTIPDNLEKMKYAARSSCQFASTDS